MVSFFNFVAVGCWAVGERISGAAFSFFYVFFFQALRGGGALLLVELRACFADRVAELFFLGSLCTNSFLSLFFLLAALRSNANGVWLYLINAGCIFGFSVVVVAAVVVGGTIDDAPAAVDDEGQTHPRRNDRAPHTYAWLLLVRLCGSCFLALSWHRA